MTQIVDSGPGGCVLKALELYFDRLRFSLGQGVWRLVRPTWDRCSCTAPPAQDPAALEGIQDKGNGNWRWRGREEAREGEGEQRGSDTVQDGVVRVCGLARRCWVRGASRLTGSSPARIPPQRGRRCGPARYSWGIGTSQRGSPAYQNPPLNPQACCLCRFARAGSSSLRSSQLQATPSRGSRDIWCDGRNITANGHVCRAARACLAFPAAHQNNFAQPV